VIARLHGTVLRHATSGTPDTVAVTELRGITTRPDLLGEVAGMFAASDYPWPERNQRAVALLLAAGADRDVMAAHETVVRARLSRRPPAY